MKSNAIDFFRFSILLISLLAMFQFLLIKGVRFSEVGQTGKVNKIFDHQIKTDVMVFGPSVAEVGINTNVLSRKLNKSVYNAAIDGTAFPQYKCLVEELADYTEDTKYVIFAVTYFDFMKRHKLHEPSRFYAHLNNEHVYNDFKAIDRSGILKMRYVPFYSITQYSQTFYKNSLIGWTDYFMKSERKDTLNGFIPHYSKFVNTLVKEDSSQTVLSLDTLQIASFRTLKVKLDKLGIKVIVVFMPMYKEGQRHFVNLDEIVNTMKGCVDPGYFINCTNQEYCDDQANFYNNNHLNFSGASLVTEDIGQQLLNMGIID